MIDFQVGTDLAHATSLTLCLERGCIVRSEVRCFMLMLHLLLNDFRTFFEWFIMDISKFQKFNQDRVIVSRNSTA